MNAEPGLSIGELARRAGCSVPTVRYYEQVGLLATALRNAGGHRRYGPAALQRLAFVRQCRDLGFAVDDVRALAALLDEPARPCAELRDAASKQRDAVRARLAELRLLEGRLDAIANLCASECAGAPIAGCEAMNGLCAAAAAPQRAGTALRSGS